VAEARQIGVREVLLVAAAVVITVLVAAGVTALLPREGQGVVFHTPLLIVVLIGGTALVLWRILRSQGPGPGAGPDA
jgi:FtsH-binding integral membrane protein